MNYLSSVASYIPSMPTGLYSAGTDLQDRVISTAKYYLRPTEEAVPTTHDTLEETGPSYQDLFMVLSQMKLHLDRKEYGAFRILWSELENYQGLWTEEMKKSLNPPVDGRCLDILLDPRNSLALQAIHGKVSGCLSTIRAHVEMHSLKMRNMQQDLFGDLIQLEFYLNRGDSLNFRAYACRLDKYEGIWTEEMSEHLDLFRDYRLLTQETNPEEAALLKEKVNGCMQVVQRAW